MFVAFLQPNTPQLVFMVLKGNIHIFSSINQLKTERERGTRRKQTHLLNTVRDNRLLQRSSPLLAREFRLCTRIISYSFASRYNRVGVWSICAMWCLLPKRTTTTFFLIPNRHTNLEYSSSSTTYSTSYGCARDSSKERIFPQFGTQAHCCLVNPHVCQRL